MYASVRDMAVFLVAALGELSDQAALHEAIRRAQLGTLPIAEGVDQALEQIPMDFTHSPRA
jgi:hypothetical protein